MDIRLNFINQTNDANNSSFVIIQKNISSGMSDYSSAWKVINSPGHNERHPFDFTTEFSVSASNSHGRDLPAIPVTHGETYAVSNSGEDQMMMRAAETNPSANECVVRNDCQRGTINAYVVRDGKLLASSNNVAPGQIAVFEFRPTIWIGVLSQVEEGQLLSQDDMAAINNEISLYDVASADIVAKGGGGEPITFELENVVYR